jgi:hypothetical protein
MADVLKLQSTAGMFDYPDPEDPSKGTTEQQYIEFEKNKHSVLSSLVTDELWQPSTAYKVGQVVKSPNMPANVVARVVTAGISASAEPVWSSAGNTMADGTVTWVMLYRTIDYATQEEVTAGKDTTKVVTPAMLGRAIKTDLASEKPGTLNAVDKDVVGGVTGILPASHGGTGATSLDNVTVGLAKSLTGDAGLLDYLQRLGINPTLPTTNAALNALGVFMSFFNQNNKIANQPTQYGQLLNLPADKGSESTQLWIDQPTGKMFHRGGNGSIAINDTSFKRFLDTDDLSAAGVVAGDVSNANAWWVKLSGAIPIIIQGGIGGSSFVYPLSLSKVLTVAFSLNSGVWSYNWYTQDSKVNISNTAASNPKGFPYNWLVFGIV